MTVPGGSDLTVVLLGEEDEARGGTPYLHGRTVVWRAPLLVNQDAEISGSGSLVFSTGLPEQDARAWHDGQSGVSAARVEAAVRELASGAMGLETEDVGVRMAFPGNGPAVARTKPASTLSHGTARRRASAEVSVVLSGRAQAKLRRVRARTAAPLFPEKTEAQLRREDRARITRLEESNAELKESNAELKESHAELEEKVVELAETVANHGARIRALEAALRGVLDPLATRMIIEALQRVIVMAFYNVPDDELPRDAVRDMKNRPPKPDKGKRGGKLQRGEVTDGKESGQPAPDGGLVGNLPPVLTSKWIPFVTDLERRLQIGDDTATFRAFAEDTLGVPGYVLDVVAGKAASRMYTTVSAPFHKGDVGRALTYADGNPSVPPEGHDAPSWEACRVRLLAAIKTAYDVLDVPSDGEVVGGPGGERGTFAAACKWLRSVTDIVCVDLAGRLVGLPALMDVA